MLAEDARNLVVDQAIKNKNKTRQDYKDGKLDLTNLTPVFQEIKERSEKSISSLRVPRMGYAARGCPDFPINDLDVEILRHLGYEVRTDIDCYSIKW